MRIHNNILRSFAVLALACGLSACDAQEGVEPEVQVDAQAQADSPAQVETVTPEQDVADPFQPAQEEAAEEVVEETPKAKPVEELIEPEVMASIPDVITEADNERLAAQYEATVEACGEIRTICLDEGHGDEKCVQIEQGCKEAAESLRSGATTRAGLVSVLKDLVEAVLGVGDVGVGILRCASRLIGCALSTLSLHCVTDLVECLVEEVVAS